MSVTYTNYSHPVNQVKNIFHLQIAEKPTAETPIAFPPASHQKTSHLLNSNNYSHSPILLRMSKKTCYNSQILPQEFTSPFNNSVMVLSGSPATTFSLFAFLSLSTIQSRCSDGRQAHFELPIGG